MKLSTQKKLALEEIPQEHRGWFGKVLNPLNKFIEQVFFAISKGLTIGDNLKAQTFSLKITADQDYPMKVSWTINERPTAVLLASIIEDTGAPGTIPVHSHQWEFSNGSISITFNGLEATKAYKAVVVGLV